MKLTAEGVYDYFCMPHERAGIVGRLIVGLAAGPGAPPFDYFKAKGKRLRIGPARGGESLPEH
jgi:hypothetical protein